MALGSVSDEVSSVERRLMYESKCFAAARAMRLSLRL